MHVTGSIMVSSLLERPSEYLGDVSYMKFGSNHGGPARCPCHEPEVQVHEALSIHAKHG